MKKSSFQIQQYDFGWHKITRCINSEELQQKIMNTILKCDNHFVKIGLLSPNYAPLYRMRLRDKSWFYFSANPAFNIVDGKLNFKEDTP